MASIIPFHRPPSQHPSRRGNAGGYKNINHIHIEYQTPIAGHEAQPADSNTLNDPDKKQLIDYHVSSVLNEAKKAGVELSGVDEGKIRAAGEYANAPWAIMTNIVQAAHTVSPKMESGLNSYLQKEAMANGISAAALSELLAKHGSALSAGGIRALINSAKDLQRAERGETSAGLLWRGSDGSNFSSSSGASSGNMTPNTIRYSNGNGSYGTLHGSDINMTNYGAAGSPFTATGMTYGTFNNVRTSPERFTSTGRERFNEANVLVGAQDSKRIGLTNNERTIRNIAVIDGADPVAREKIIKGVEAFQKKTQTDPQLRDIIRDGVQTYQASKATSQEPQTPQQKANAAIAFENAKGRLVGSAIKDSVQNGTAKVIQSLPADAQAAAYETAFKDGALAPLAKKLFPNDPAKQNEFVNTWGNADTTKPEQVKAFEDAIRKEAGQSPAAKAAVDGTIKVWQDYVAQKNAAAATKDAAAATKDAAAAVDKAADLEAEKLLMGTAPSTNLQPADPSTKPAAGQQAAIAPDAPKPNAAAKPEDVQNNSAPASPATQGSNAAASGTTSPAAVSTASASTGQPAAKEPTSPAPAAAAPSAKVDAPAPAEAKKAATAPAPKMN